MIVKLAHTAVVFSAVLISSAAVGALADNCMSAGGAAAGTTTQEQINAMDANRDGIVTRAEYGSCPSGSEAFAASDKNGDGSLDRTEQAALVSAQAMKQADAALKQANTEVEKAMMKTQQMMKDSQNMMNQAQGMQPGGVNPAGGTSR